MCRYDSSSLESDSGSSKSPNIIIDEDYVSFFIYTHEVTISIMGKVAKHESLAIEITIVGDHPSRPELASSIDK